MIPSAITISQVSEARGGPFVLWDELSTSMQTAARLGFDAVELFLPSHETVSVDTLRQLLSQHGLRLAAVGTGAGWVIHRLKLTDGEMDRREAAKLFVRQMIDFGAQFDAPAIIGSMQGSFDANVSKDKALHWLGEALRELGEHAAAAGQCLLYEPLNRYETNLCNTIEAGVQLLQQAGAGDSVKLLADLFHMNIEEVNVADAIRKGGAHIGHVHFADSNRWSMGQGHTDPAQIVEAMKEIGYSGYASAEVFPLPTQEQAAANIIDAHRKWFG